MLAWARQNTYPFILLLIAFPLSRCTDLRGKAFEQDSKIVIVPDRNG
jgi:hypothetical protein